MRPKAEEKAAAPVLSQQQLDERSGQCAKVSREQFRRAWNEGAVDSADGPKIAQFANHYNPKLDTCFYLLTVASSSTLDRMLFDINGGELYGEYSGPATIPSPASGYPKTCRVESIYCASEGEWEVLIEPYMEEWRAENRH